MAAAPIQGNPVLPRLGSPARFGKVAPSDISSAAPRATYIDPSVAMKGATPRRDTIQPLTAPIAIPAAQREHDHEPGVRKDDDAQRLAGPGPG